MGERKGTNKYYPPDFDPQKHGSLAGYHGEHPLRERARKLHKGILIIRFEMPYNIWCNGCGNHIAMSVRFNAEKSKIGMYYTTPIYKFRMKCHLCDQHFEIKTDPANHDYVIISGARRKEQRWDPVANEQIVPEDRGTQKRLADDAMFKLEHGAEDKSKVAKAQPTLAKIAAKQSRLQDDFAMNQLARSQFRSEKKTIAAETSEKTELLKKSSLDIQLVEETESDKRLASLMKFTSSQSYDDKQKQKRDDIHIESIFKTPTDKTSSRSSSSGSSGSKSKLLRSQRKKANAKSSLLSAVSKSKAASQNVFGTSTSAGLSAKGLLGIKGIVKPKQKTEEASRLEQRTGTSLSSNDDCLNMSTQSMDEDCNSPCGRDNLHISDPGTSLESSQDLTEDQQIELDEQQSDLTSPSSVQPSVLTCGSLIGDYSSSSDSDNSN